MLLNTLTLVLAIKISIELLEPSKHLNCVIVVACLSPLLYLIVPLALQFGVKFYKCLNSFYRIYVLQLYILGIFVD